MGRTHLTSLVLRCCVERSCAHFDRVRYNDRAFGRNVAVQDDGRNMNAQYECEELGVQKVVMAWCLTVCNKTLGHVIL